MTVEFYSIIKHLNNNTNKKNANQTSPLEIKYELSAKYITEIILTDTGVELAFPTRIGNLNSRLMPLG